MKPQNLYGSGFYEKLSRDLVEELPDVKSFSPRNLRYMNDFYLLYSEACKIEKLNVKITSSNLQHLVAKSEYESIFRIPWGKDITV